ncbi:hypothetical protein GCM10017653_14540 [Ancylobacter defluvii]|uniref:Toprim domain-containing protein n=1 Tax=Ancylobacter defluvii TaxID=1282440 RepID=A0A9W6JT77_9HYPH|nr:hypothetical protein GCM10017653_14540 [Ancylobacter defluvii]
MIAVVTDLGGKVTGAHRTWPDPRHRDKAPIDTPRRAMGDLLSNAVRFGLGSGVMAACEGIETVLSLRQVLPDMPMLAARSAAHLAAIRFPDTLRRLYIVRDNDPAGNNARDSLIGRANAVGIEAIVLAPRLGDFNEDLRRLGVDSLRTLARVQVAPRTSPASWRWRHSPKEEADGIRRRARADASHRRRGPRLGLHGGGSP